MPNLLDSLSGFKPSPGRFLHLIPDDKFIDVACGIFEEASPGAHDYLIIGRAGTLRHIRTFHPHRLEIDMALKPEFLSLFPSYSAVFIHYLANAARHIVFAAPVETRFIWLGWGADYYHLICPRDELLLPRTREWLARSLRTRKIRNVLELLEEGLRSAMSPARALRLLALRARLREFGPGSRGEIELVNRFDAIATPIVEDFRAMLVRYPELRVSFLDWNYWTEGFCAHDLPSVPSGNNILLGNSATPENNHLDALEFLSGFPIGDRKVICPLSYGDRQYGNAVEKYGRKLLGERFVPLRKYIDSGAYAKILGSCSIVIMNHIRQQALGNIVLALCSGAHVFLNARNPVNAAMRRMGVEVEVMESLPGFMRGDEPALLPQRLHMNRERLENQYGRSSILRRTRMLLDNPG